MEISDQDREALRTAKGLLERTNVAIKLANMLGYSIEHGVMLLPERWSEPIQQATRKALEQALQSAIRTLNKDRRTTPANFLHRGLVAASGAASGMMGLGALLLELPVSTTLILRSIADIARSEGENLSEPECQLACLEVFALGGRSSDDESAETGYFAVRTALARSVSEAASFLAKRGLTDQGAPALVRLIGAIAARFQSVVSEKVLAQSVPILGAIGGAAVNTIFIDHFQNVARGHFIVRRLERTYGTESVRSLYAQLVP